MFTNSTCLLVVVVVLCIFVNTRRRRNKNPLPPGPKPLPLIGNLLDFPKGHGGKFWAKHAVSYGPISSMKVFRNTIVILSDLQLAIDLLEKKSAIYSDRLAPEFVANLCGASPSVVFQQYGERFRSIRKLFHQFMGTRAHVSRFEPLEELEARRLLLRVMRRPTQFRAHIRRLTGTVILKMAYGYTAMPDGSDPMIDLAELTLERFSQSSQPGSWLVDVFPALNYLPNWFPGTGYRKIAKDWKALFIEGGHKPFEFAKDQIATGNFSTSFVSNNIANKVADAEYEQLLLWAARDLYGGGADTTVSTLVTFILAMVLHPDVVKQARVELDHVLGEGRLPTFADRPSLPYVEAVMKECHRWNVVTPSGVPHVAAQDDVHCGYLIPKGAVIVPNIWKFTHDPNIYRDPFAFKPERHLARAGRPAELDPRNLVFGFGRRICPGREFADSSLFITMAMCLAVFNFDKALDANGHEIEPTVEYTSGTISHPSEFACSITPRSEKAAVLIESVLQEHPFESGDADKLREVKC